VTKTKSNSGTRLAALIATLDDLIRGATGETVAVPVAVSVAISDQLKRFGRKPSLGGPDDLAFAEIIAQALATRAELSISGMPKRKATDAAVREAYTAFVKIGRPLALGTIKRFLEGDSISKIRRLR
jgi:hypothetical protein